MTRYGMMIGLKPEAEQEYRELHAAVWPEVIRTIHNCNIRNYSIFAKNGLLFSYFEYHGDDFNGDMAKMAADAATQKWWSITMPMQTPVASRRDGEWWAAMQEVFHLD